MARKTSRNKPATAVTVAPAPDSPERRWKAWWLFGCALAAALIVFSPALHGLFVFDDFHLPFADPKAEDMPASFWIGGVRPVLMATYWLNYLMSGTDAFSYHAVSIVLHSGTAVLVFFILQRLFSLAGVTRAARAYALTGAAIFLFHPLQTESVDYIAGRSEVVSGLLFCAAWLGFLQAFESETGVWTSVKIMLLGTGAVLAKENAICLPAVLFATDLFWAKQPLAAHLRRRVKLYVPFVLGAAAGSVWILRSAAAGGSAGFSSIAASGQYALTQCRSILTYVRLFLVPVGQNGDWQAPLFHSLADGAAWMYVLGLLALLAVIVRFYRRLPLLSFGLLIFLLMLAPTSSVIPIKDALAERRMYVPIIGLILAAVAIFIPISDRLRLNAGQLRIVAAVAVLSAAGLSWHRSAVWSGPLAFWNDAALKNPTNSRAHLGFGAALMVVNNCKSAVRELTVARTEDPSNDEITWNLAEALQCDNQPERAVELFQAFALRRPSADAWNKVAYCEARLGKSDALLDAIDKALSLDSNNATSYAYRGLARLALNNFDGAHADFTHSLELDPRNPAALEGSQRLAGIQNK